MKRVGGLLIIICLMAGVIPGLCHAQEDLTVVQSSCMVLVGETETRVQCFAQLHNNTDKVVYMGEGFLELFNDQTVIADKVVARIWPEFINPGEDGYVFDEVPFEPDADGQPFIPNVTGITYHMDTYLASRDYSNLPLDVSAVLEDDTDGRLTVRFTIVNRGKEDAWNPTLAFGLYTDGGSLIFTGGTGFEDICIPSGSTIEKKYYVGSDLINKWNEYGAKPAEVHVTCCYRNDTD